MHLKQGYSMKIIIHTLLLLFFLQLSGCSIFPEKTYKSKTRISTNEKSIEFSAQNECYFDYLNNYPINNENSYKKLNDICKTQVFYPSIDKQQLMVVLEMNEQGRFVDKSHIQTTLDHINNLREQNNVIVSLFVHGWNHGSRIHDSDLHNFQYTLNDLYNQKHLKGKPVKNIGIYIGWRGRTLPSALNYATFWGRKNISVNIGKGDLGAFILDLERVVKKEKSNYQGSLILSGHSFGASALYHALGPILISRFQDSITQKQILRGVGDLIVLINPAIEAKQFLPLRETIWRHAAKENTDTPDIFKNNLYPFFVVLGSNGDFAVNNLFPTGRWLNTANDKYDRTSIINGNDRTCNTTSCINKKVKYCQVDKDCLIPENLLDRHAIGNFPWFHTHWLTSDQPKPNIIESSIQNTSKILQINSSVQSNISGVTKCHNSDQDWLKSTIKEKRDNNWETNIATLEDKAVLKLSTKFIEDNWKNFGLNQRKEPESTTTAQSTTWNRNPYWFVRVNGKVIPDHSEIWNQQVGCFILSITKLYQE